MYIIFFYNVDLICEANKYAFNVFVVTFLVLYGFISSILTLPFVNNSLYIAFNNPKSPPLAFINSFGAFLAPNPIVISVSGNVNCALKLSPVTCPKTIIKKRSA
jgi:hypothetical protein